MSTERDGCAVGCMDGWIDEEEMDMGLSYGTRHSLSLCVISSPPNLCAFLLFILIMKDGGRTWLITAICHLVVDFLVICWKHLDGVATIILIYKGK